MAGQQTYPNPCKLVSALRVIHTWAEFDVQEGQVVALAPEDVIGLVNKTMFEWRAAGGVDDD